MGKKIEFLHLSFVVPGVGVRSLVAEVVRADFGGRSPQTVYPNPGDPCSENGYFLYVSGGNLKLRTPSPSPRRLRRFIRDYVRFSGGRLESVSIWTVPWR